MEKKILVHVEEVSHNPGEILRLSYLGSNADEYETRKEDVLSIVPTYSNLTQDYPLEDAVLRLMAKAYLLGIHHCINEGSFSEFQRSQLYEDIRSAFDEATVMENLDNDLESGS